MANTYTLIAGTTLSSPAANINFSSIPTTYTDLKLVCSLRAVATSSVPGLTIKLNNVATNFTARYLEGTGSAAGSGTDTTLLASIDGSAQTANTFGNLEVYIPNYLSSNYKSYSVDGVTENNATVAYSQLLAGLWSNTAAINQITVQVSVNLDTYSTAYLYGIKNS